MTAPDILELLRTKHSKDVFVDACKTGPTWGSAFQQMDALAMARSWASPRVVAYEIKVTRADFLHDNKWPGYLPYCNELYFAVAPGVCTKDEVGKEVGLLEMAKTGTRLFTRKKAAYRDVVIPEELFRHILMSRVIVGRPDRMTSTDEFDRERKVAHWRAWLKRREEAQTIGHEVSRRLQEIYERDVRAVRIDHQQLERRVQAYEEFREQLEAEGLTLGALTRSARPIREALANAVAPHVKYRLRQLIGAAEDGISALDAAVTITKKKEAGS